MKLAIAPSLLSADFGKLNEEITTVEPYSDLLHVDVMDGHFVNNITIGPVVVKSIKTSLPLHCHLMISEPEKYIDPFIKAGASIISFHIETVSNPTKLIAELKEKNITPSLSLNPHTPIESIIPYLPLINYVLIMSVVPGFAGQAFMKEALPKIEYIRQNFPEMNIEVDGGINAETAKWARDAGANILVAGSYIFGSSDRKKAIESLRA